MTNRNLLRRAAICNLTVGRALLPVTPNETGKSARPTGKSLSTVRLNATLAVLLIGGSVAAEDQVTTIRWADLDSKGHLESGEIVPASSEGSQSAEEELLISNETGQPLTSRIVTLESPGISKFHYKVQGRIRYEGVEQPGYLEMWSHFAKGGPYFTKTLSDSGPMGVIHGASASREFILPFQSSAASGTPLKLEINLVLPANGKVWISPLSISQFDENEWGDAMTAEGAWWGNRTASLIGGILGPLLGIMGAIVGTLSGMGRGRKVAIGICWFSIVSGSVFLVAGLVAVAMSQPYAVYFPLLLMGFLSTVIMSSVLPITRKRFEDAELRRMEAMDAVVT